MSMWCLWFSQRCLTIASCVYVFLDMKASRRIRLLLKKIYDMKKNVLGSVLVLFSVACKEIKKETSEESASQMEQVITTHDALMPKMQTIGELIERLEYEMEDTAMQQPYEVAIEELQAANTAMMGWMERFGNRFSHDEILNGAVLTEEKQAWLNEEEESVKSLEEAINSSIEGAEMLLNKE